MRENVPATIRDREGARDRVRAARRLGHAFASAAGQHNAAHVPVMHMPPLPRALTRAQRKAFVPNEAAQVEDVGTPDPNESAGTTSPQSAGADLRESEGTLKKRKRNDGAHGSGPTRKQHASAHKVIGAAAIPVSKDAAHHPLASAHHDETDPHWMWQPIQDKGLFDGERPSDRKKVVIAVNVIMDMLIEKARSDAANKSKSKKKQSKSKKGAHRR